MGSSSDDVETLWHSESIAQTNFDLVPIGQSPKLPSGIGLEASENALVWKVYNVESAKADAAILDACHRSIDVLLIFTGLFCTVLTTFIVQAYQFLVQGLDFNAPSTQIPSTTSQTMAPSVAPSFLQLQWVNALWFTSLAFSLCNAMFCMLGKQWLHPVCNFSGSSARSRARERQRRYMQMRAWYVLTIIDALPLFLHVGLLLFFAGLVILVWVSNHAIAIITCIVLLFVYVSYLGSVLLSLAHPDCPYRHPLSDRLRDWKARSYRYFLHLSPLARDPFRDVEQTAHESYGSWVEDGTESDQASVLNLEDYLDAHALVWLLKHCPNDTITSITLQAIGGLPRNFTAFHILRKAGAISLVLRGFRACFHKDLTLDSQWLVLQAQDAEKYCRAWLRLTYGTSIKWPHEFLDLLETLRKVEDTEDVGAIAACTRAVAFLDVRDSHFLIIHYLTGYVDLHSHFSQETLYWLLETFLQCSLLSPTQLRPKNHIAGTMVPILLRLLHVHLSKDTTAANVRSAIALCLSYMTGGTTDPNLFDDASRRPDEFYKILIPALTEVVKEPTKYGADETLLNQMVIDFMHVVTRMSKNDSKDWNTLRPTVQVGLSKLYIHGRISNVASDALLTDMLKMLLPPDHIAAEDRPPFVKALIQTVSSSTHSSFLLRSVLHLLEALLSRAEPPILDAFIESNGCEILLDGSDVREMGSRILQLSCVKSICLFVMCTADNLPPIISPLNQSEKAHNERLEHILQSQFLCVITAMLKDSSCLSVQIETDWLPALLRLCEYCPSDPRWKSVETALSDFARRYEGKYGHGQLIQHLGTIKTLIDSD